MKAKPHGVKAGQLVVIDWLDAVAHAAGWDDAPKNRAELTRSVGLVTAATSDAITVAGDWGPKEGARGHVNRAFTIPWGMVRHVRQVRVSECRRLA